MPSSDTWRHKAACRNADSELFFISDGATRSEEDCTTLKVQTQYCFVCPVRLQCVEEGEREQDKYTVRTLGPYDREQVSYRYKVRGTSLAQRIDDGIVRQYKRCLDRRWTGPEMDILRETVEEILARRPARGSLRVRS